MADWQLEVMELVQYIVVVVEATDYCKLEEREVGDDIYSTDELVGYEGRGCAVERCNEDRALWRYLDIRHI